MSAHDLFVDSFPHGTVKGSELGCRTNHCPAPIACHVFRTRYMGDHVFRKRVDAGWTVDRIAAVEAEEAAAVVEAERAARQAAASRKRRPKSLRPKDKPKRSMNKRPWSDDDVRVLQRMNADGAKDGEIALTLGRSRPSVNEKRRALRIAAAPPDRYEHGSTTGYARYGCKGDDCPATPSCGEVGRAYYRNQHAKKTARKNA